DLAVRFSIARKYRSCREPSQDAAVFRRTWGRAVDLARVPLAEHTHGRVSARRIRGRDLREESAPLRNEAYPSRISKRSSIVKDRPNDSFFHLSAIAGTIRPV